MILIVDERSDVFDGYTSYFDREGVPACGVRPDELARWLEGATDTERNAIDAILLGNMDGRADFFRSLKSRLKAVVIALNEQRSLDETLDLFAAGIDDVVRKPVHAKEILARVAAIRRRSGATASAVDDCGDAVVVFLDGRDPEVNGMPLKLPRREKRILEYLVLKRGCRVTKSQLFTAVYGLFNDHIDENIIESHISKLRKRLRASLGYDPISSQRFLGYCFENETAQSSARAQFEATANAA